jgi:hypothetical protein
MLRGKPQVNFYPFCAMAKSLSARPPSTVPLALNGLRICGLQTLYC